MKVKNWGIKSCNLWKIIYSLVVLLIFLSVIFSAAIPAMANQWNQYVRVDENVTYRPYVDGTITEDWTAVGRSTMWDCVDEDPDANGNYNDNDYVLGEGTNHENAYLLFNRVGTLYSPEGMRGVDVTVYYRVRDNALALSTDNNARAVLRVGGVDYFGGSVNPPGAFQDFQTYSHTWTVNPATGQEWTWNDLWAGSQFGVYSDDLQPSVRVSAVWMVMKYDLVAPFATLDFAAASYQETDGAEKSIGVRLSNATTNTVTVNYTVGSGNASPGEDYVAPYSGSLTFAPGETFKSIDGIYILDDYTHEGTETFNITLTGVTNGRMGSVNTSTWTIINNDPDVYLYIYGTRIAEGNSGNTTVTGNVRLYSPSDNYPTTPVIVSYNTAEDTTLHYGAVGSGPTADYVPTSGTLTFAPGEINKTFNVTIIGDNVYEADEFFMVELSNPVGASFNEWSWHSGVNIENDDNKPALNEFVVDHAGPDNYEFIEIYGAPSANYADFRILIIENDPAENPGVIEKVLTVGTTNAQGFWRTPTFAQDSLENGSQIMLLVRHFTGAVGQDLDADNNRQIDYPYPWAEDIDGVMLFNPAPTEELDYDWNRVFGAGGASRIPNGTGTWVPNDFDGAGLPALTGTLTSSEALNTPGLQNSMPLGTGPIITDEPDDTTVSLGRAASFTAAATGTPSPSVHWEVNTGTGGWVDIVNGPIYWGVDTPGISLRSLTLSYSGYQYRAIFTNGFNPDAVTRAATLTVTPVAPATPVITWSNPADIIYGTALSSAQLNATASTSGSFAYSPTAGTVLNAGNSRTLHVDFTPADTSSYTNASADVSINVLKSGQTITFNALSNKTYGDAPFAVSATASSGLPVTFAITSGPATIDASNMITITGAGTVTVTASQGGNENYNPATAVSRSFNVAKAAATVVLSDLTRTYTGSSQSPTATTTPPGLPIVWTNAPQTNAGSYSVTATVNHSNYQGSASGTFVIQAVYTLTVNQPATGGLINIEPYQETYASGSTVQLSVSTVNGYDFTGWGGDASSFGTTTPITITMNSNKTITANFVQLEYSVNLYTDPLVPGCSASFVGSMGPFHVGDTVTVSASGGFAYHFTGWSGNPYGLDPSLADDNPLTFAMPPLNFDLTANFEINTYSLTVNYDTSMGSVSPGGGRYPHGEIVYLNADPNTGYHLTTWGGDASGTSPSTSVVMDSDKTVTAAFAIDFYQLYTSASGNGTVYQDGNSSSPQSYPYHTEVSLSAEPAPGWSFDHWNNDVDNPMSANTSITMNTLGDRYVTAYFINNPPVAEAGGPYSGNEGSPVSVDASGSSDAGGSITSYEWDWDNNGTFDTSGSSPTASHTWADNGTFTIGLRVTDGAGLTATDTATVTVNNVAPAATFNKPASVNEGILITISLTGPSDPGSVDTAAGFQYAFDFGDGYSAFGSTSTASATASDGPAALTVKGKIKDKDGGVTEYTGTVTVNNVAPTIDLSGDATVNEASTYSLTLGIVGDEGQDTVSAYTINWGDGTTENLTGSPNGLIKTHTYADGSNSYTIGVEVTDEDGVFADAGSKSITVNNVVPTISLSGGSSVNEGSVYTLNLGTVVDPGTDAVTDYTINWGDGTTENFAAPVAASRTHTYGDGLTSPTISVDLKDEDGTFTDAGTKTITVNNVAPTISLNGNETTDEGSSYSLTLGTVVDPGQDTIASYSINWGDGTTETFTGSPNGLIKTHTYADGPLSPTITVSLTDEDDTFTGGTRSITVNNVVPTASADDSEITVNEGVSANNTGTFSDPGTDDVTIGASVGTVNKTGSRNGTWSWSYATTDGPTQSQTVTITANDGDGGVNTTTFHLTVNNVKPVVTAPADQKADEGTLKAFTLGSLTDLGADNPWAVDVDWGDGSAHTTFNLATAGAITDQSHTFPDNDTYTVTVQVTDKDGASDSQTFSVVVSNIAPTVTAPSNQTADEGTSKSFNLGSFSDPGADNPWAVDVDWGDGSGHTTFNLATAGAITDQSHSFPDNGAYTVSVQVADKDGANDSKTFDIVVANVAPTVDVGADATVAWGNTFTQSGSFTDPGADTWEATVDYGDGTGDQALTLTSKSFTLSHVYVNDQIGNHTVTVTVTDDDGGVDDDTLVGTVTKRDTRLVYSGDAQVEYSDPATVKATLTDSGGETLQGTQLENRTITFIINTENANDTTDTNGLAETTITLNQIPETSYTVDSSFDGDTWYNPSSDSDAFSIGKEKAVITFDSSNPVAKQVANPGDPGVTLSSEDLFTVRITQEADGKLGTQDLTGTLIAKLVPVGGGGGIDLVLVGSPDLSAFPGGGPAVYTFTGPTASIPIETYTIEITLSDPYYDSAQGEDVFVVYDPSLGFTTGGGWFYWPGTNDKTNFGFTMKYTKKATSIQGSLLVIRHLSDGSGVVYRIKSNALDGLAVTSTGTPGTATFSGKCTYIGPDSTVDVFGNLVNEGGQQFTVYVEDGDNPGELPDKFWFSVLGREFSLDLSSDPANAEAIVIEGGNIVVPHTPGSGSNDNDENQETSGTPPTVASVSPSSGNPGGTLTIVITGDNFGEASGVSLGAKITVTSFNVDSETQITANITIASSAKPGTRDVLITTFGCTGTLAAGFLVN